MPLDDLTIFSSGMDVPEDVADQIDTLDWKTFPEKAEEKGLAILGTFNTSVATSSSAAV
jgi:hypothetical protein